ncbi:MAG: hypothetical protein IKV68_01515 [Oscillospiraceae bacterium]|nr:hypothetical protein [Oscillospiraceae bacterium]
MKILIIARYFSPYNHIASIRLTKLAKYLQRMGYEVTVLTGMNNTETLDPILMEDEKEISRIVRADNSRLYYAVYNFIYGVYKKNSNAAAASAAPAANTAVPADADAPSFKNKLKAMVREALHIYENYDFAHQAKKQLRAVRGQYDVILSSFGPHSSHLLGLHYKKRNCAPVWIADFRDAISFEDYTLSAGWSKRFLARVFTRADHITAVSQGVIDQLELPATLSRTVISNAFDGEDLRFVAQTSQDDRICYLSYPGQLYSGKRDLSPIFRCIQDLSTQGEIDLSRIRINYAGSNYDELQRQAAPYGLTHILIDHGYVNRQASLEMQTASDLLLLASWNNVGNTGIVTGKFLEYLMMRKPIVCVISGNLPNSALKEMIDSANVGFCYEAAGPDDSYDQLKQYILMVYRAAVNGAQLDFFPDENNIAQYTYAQKASTFAELFHSLNR